MRDLSASTRLLIDDLRDLPKRVFSLVRKRNAAATRLLRKIAASAEPAALPEILSFVLAKDQQVARSAARTASVLLSLIPVTADLG